MTTSKNQTPTVSIGLPVYNGARFINKAIDSILAQTYEDFELIIVDNDSTDDTVSICEEYAAKDGRIRIVRNEQNIGAAPNFNKVFGLATGKYFKWAAHDDWIEPEFLAKCVEILDTQSDVSLCHTSTRIYSEDEEVLEDYVDGIDGLNDDPSKRFVSMMKDMRLVFPVFGVMRRELAAKTALMESIGGGDRPFMGQMALAGKIHLVPELLYNNRKTLSARTGRDNRSWWDASQRKNVRPRVTLLAKSWLAAIKRSDLPRRKKLTLSMLVCKHFATMRRFIMLREWKYVVISRIPLARRAQ